MYHDGGDIQELARFWQYHQKLITMNITDLTLVLTVIMLALWAINAHAGFQPPTRKVLNSIIIVNGVVVLILALIWLLRGTRIIQ